MEDREATGPAITLVDGTTVPRLPGFRRWMWNGEFCGSIGFRWQPRTTTLPLHCLGHIGYTVVPWKQMRGYATAATRQLLPLARAEGLASADIATNVGNLASQRVIQTNGGVLVDEFTKTAANGGGAGPPVPDHPVLNRPPTRSGFPATGGAGHLRSARASRCLPARWTRDRIAPGSAFGRNHLLQWGNKRRAFQRIEVADSRELSEHRSLLFLTEGSRPPSSSARPSAPSFTPNGCTASAWDLLA